jgi:hypothetical protein
LLCEQIIVKTSKEVKTGCNLAESSMKDKTMAQKGAVLPMMMNNIL